MNLAPLLAELSGLRALPTGLLRPAQQERLEIVRSALALAQHVLPGINDELPRVRLIVDGRVQEGCVIGCGRGSLQLRLPVGGKSVESAVALLHFSDGRPPRAFQASLDRGPIEGYWELRALDGMLDDAEQICEGSQEQLAPDRLAISL